MGPLAGKMDFTSIAAQSPDLNALKATNVFPSLEGKIPFDLNRRISFDNINATNISSSFQSFDSPNHNAEKFQNLFDLSDLKADLNEFNNFYNMNDCAPYSKIERPQNPFEKNFEINRKSSGLDMTSDIEKPEADEKQPAGSALLLTLTPVE